MADKEGDRERSHGQSGNSNLIVSDQEQDLAQTALTDFTKGNYSACLASLTKLEATWTHDTKVAHNKAVAEFYKSNLKKTDQFKKNLNNLRSQPIWNGDEVVRLDDVEQCALYYNHAVLLFHLKQYNLALKIIKEVFIFIEPMEESLAHKVCLLLIELLLCMRQVDTALEYISYITSQFASTKNIQVLEKEPTEKKPIVFDAATDAFRLKLLQCQTRCYLMNKCLKGSKKELKTIMTTGGNNVPSIFLKANLEYLKRNYTKSIKVLNSLLSHTLPTFKDAGESVNVLYYNNMACIHHYMRKPNLACYYLQKAIKENEDAIRSFPKPEPPEELSNRPLFTLGSNKNAELMYNLGVVLLYAGKPTKAFDCLTEAVQVYHMNPRLWLRMAECCIMAHKSSNEEDSIHKRKNDLVQNIIGTGLHRKLVLANKLSKENPYSNECQSYAIPAPTLEFASLCVKNALHLLPPGEKGEIREGPTTPLSEPTAANLEKSSEPKSAFYGAPSSPIGEMEVKNLRCSVLATAAYVALCLGDYFLALEYAQELLVQRPLSGVHKMLGHLYAAEACVLCNRISEAIEHLSPDLITDLSIGLAQPIEDCVEENPRPLKDWYPNSLLPARALMEYHLAVAFAIRGEFEKSGETLKRVWVLKGTCDIPIQVIMLALYIELQLVKLKADFERSIVKVTQLGRNACGLNGLALKKDSAVTANHGDRIEVLLGQFVHVVEFDPPPQSDPVKEKSPKDGEKTSSSSEPTKVTTDKPKRNLPAGGTTPISEPAAKKSRKSPWESVENGKLLIYSPEELKPSPLIAAYDLDGTLICTQSGAVFPKNRNDWKMQYKEVLDKLECLHKQGFKILVFTNQAGLTTGKQSVKAFKNKIEDIVQKINLPVQVFISTTYSIYRKPAIGMWEAAMERNDNLKVDMTRSFYCGDAAGREAGGYLTKSDFSHSDLLFAKNLELNFETPEHHFLNKQMLPLKVTIFDPKTIPCDVPLCEPSYGQVISNKLEVIILVGIPGSGKTHFAKTHLIPAGYVHVNRDTLGTHNRCVSVMHKALILKQKVVVDNTNPDVESRKRFIDIAKAYTPIIRCFVMNTSFQHARHNNRFRQLIDPSSAVGDAVLNTFKLKYQEPTLAEGFTEILKINFWLTFKNPEHEKLYKLFLLEK